MLTLSEYLKVVNEEGKIHPDNAYQISVDSISNYNKPSNYPFIDNNLYANGILFQLRHKKHDQWADSYTKTNKDGTPVYDDKGKATYLSQAEKETAIPERYLYQDAVIDVKADKVVAYTDREWGAILIAVAKEYQGFGIGAKIHHKHRTRYPDITSGGLTPSGQSSLIRTYQRMVSLALSNGEYRRAYLEGTMSHNQINKVIKSALILNNHIIKRRQEMVEFGYDEELALDLVTDYRRPSLLREIDLNFSKKEDWLLHVQENYAILYDKKMYGILKGDQKYEYFHEQGILGYAYIGGAYGTDEIPKLFRHFGKTEVIKNFMIEVALNTSLGSPIRMTKEDLKPIETLLGDKITSVPVLRSPWIEVTLNEQTIGNLSTMAFIEKKTQRLLDNYEEGFTVIHEMASAIADNIYDCEVEALRYSDNSPGF